MKGEGGLKEWGSEGGRKKRREKGVSKKCEAYRARKVASPPLLMRHS